jgi:hypothetical protein
MLVNNTYLQTLCLYIYSREYIFVMVSVVQIHVRGSRIIILNYYSFINGSTALCLTLATCSVS